MSLDPSVVYSNVAENIVTGYYDLAEKNKDQMEKISDGIEAKFDALKRIKMYENQLNTAKKHLTASIAKAVNEKVYENPHCKNSVKGIATEIINAAAKPDSEDNKGNVISGYLNSLIGKFILLANIYHVLGEPDFDNALSNYGVTTDYKTCFNLTPEQAQELKDEITGMLSLKENMENAKSMVKSELLQLLPTEMRKSQNNPQGLDEAKMYKILETKFLAKVDRAKASDTLINMEQASVSATFFSSFTDIMINFIEQLKQMKTQKEQEEKKIAEAVNQTKEK